MLSAQIHESSSAAALDNTDILYIARAAHRRVMSINLGAGAHMPAYCASMGRIMLAALPAPVDADILNRYRLIAYTAKTKADLPAITTELAVVAAQGFAVIDQELELGFVPPPLLNAQGQTVAALNIGAQTARASTSHMIANSLPLIRKAQAEVLPPCSANLSRAAPRLQSLVWLSCWRAKIVFLRAIFARLRTRPPARLL